MGDKRVSVFGKEYDGPILSVMAAIANSVEKHLGHYPDILYVDPLIYEAWGKYYGRGTKYPLFRGMEVRPLE